MPHKYFLCIFMIIYNIRPRLCWPTFRPYGDKWRVKKGDIYRFSRMPEVRKLGLSLGLRRGSVFNVSKPEA
jgi:hypothetical protein